MRTLSTLLLGLFCLLLWTVVGRYVYECILKQECATEIANTPPASSRLTNLRLQDGDIAILEGYEQFVFPKDKISPYLSTDNNTYLDAVASYLNNNPNKNVKIMGFYRPSESGVQTGFFENLGLARADAIKNLLVQRGIAKERIFIDYNEGDEELTYPIEFSLFSNTPTEMDDTEERLTTAQYSFDNMVFSDANFEINSAVFIPGEAFINWADSVTVYFEQNPNKTFQIIGHADKIGPDQHNKELGLERALAARKYFEEKGVSVKMKVNSMGEKQPIATNKTKEGRQRNRRVNFIIK